MDIKKSVKNSVSSMTNNIVSILVGLIAQTIFIKLLGSEFLGLNGLFTNIVSMLGIVELGLGNAIVYNLYKPMAQHDIESLKSLVNFYRKTYNVIIVVILILSIIILPFLPFFISETTLDIDIYLIYFLFILDVICSYVLSYKRCLLYADQSSYIISNVHVLYVIFLNFFRLIVLFFTKSYYLYLMVKVLMTLIENFLLSLIVDKKYSFVKEKNACKLSKQTKKNIFEKIKALFLYKIASFIVSSTDNLVISKYLGLVTVGLYSNYYLIINALNTLITQGITALTSNVGILLVEKNSDKNFHVFKKLRFLNFWLACFSSVCLFVIMDSFIAIWVGSEYILSKIVLLVLVINYFQSIMRSCYITFKEAAGIYEEDRFVPILQAITNVFASIILVQIIGLSGVFLGTIISELYWWLYSYPKLIYIRLFQRKISCYLKETLGYFFVFFLTLLITFYCSMYFVFDSVIIQFLANVFISVFLSNAIMLIIFWKNDNFKYFLNYFKNTLYQFFIKKGENNFEKN